MLKRTIFISNPFHIETRYNQLRLKSKETQNEIIVPIEDIGYLIIENQRVTISIPTIQKLSENNVAVVFCNDKHSPSSMLLNLNGHHIQQERFRKQLEASKPLQKQLWQQTIKAKINNQAALLKVQTKKYESLLTFSKNVQSGDSTNREALASKFYWQNLFEVPKFKRERFGIPPNQQLNYGYTILRAATARALIGVGLLPTLGIHHHNRYNDFCLADDIMEPYRPYVDQIVLQMINDYGLNEELCREEKQELLQVLTVDVKVDEQIKPLMIALNQTASSLRKCFEGVSRKLIYPQL